MDHLDLTLPAAAENVALDEALLLAAEAGQGGELLRLWEQPGHAVVLGSGCKLAEDVEVGRCQADGVPIVRRSSGGGTVLLGHGCLCYSLVLNYQRSAALEGIRTSYQWIMERVAEALGVAGAEQAGVSDLMVGGYKFSGNAQQRKRHHLLHHGTILYAMDLDAVGRYLKLPARQPDYRAGRDHAAFIRNVGVPREWIAAGLRRAWGATTRGAAVPLEEARRLAREKYQTDEWTMRR